MMIREEQQEQRPTMQRYLRAEVIATQHVDGRYREGFAPNQPGRGQVATIEKPKRRVKRAKETRTVHDVDMYENISGH